MAGNPDDYEKLDVSLYGDTGNDLPIAVVTVTPLQDEGTEIVETVRNAIEEHYQ